ncbi:hypothetical protein SAMN05660649_00530 [Desulfotomaculum arcticum]|uniref:N-acetyltransferase domain-containing protein n=2 Tax=Desulfotruncus TaxID=2867377 RepID=A0A1I2NQQ2_9FIRM|nr:hypothetical protein SAMN05660649_00530 [Desulfotomaculum arcticum] [Desulfotruncus arcticus DSM 17038]
MIQMSSFTINKIAYNLKTNIKYDHKLNDIFRFAYEEYKQFYPDFKEWFYDKMVIDFYKGNRIIYAIENEYNNIYGIAILKKPNNSISSNKICSLYLLKEIRKLGLGTLLFTDFYKEFNENIFNPNLVITVPEERLFETDGGIQFYRFLNNHGFKLKNANRGKYRLGYHEYVFIKNLSGVNHGNQRYNNHSAQICLRNS